MADSTFYIRYLDLSKPLIADNETWTTGGKNGQGLAPEDVEAIIMYPWSAEEKLWASPVVQGFNYAGMPHPEYFSRQYFAPTLYPPGRDGKHLLLSWTSQVKPGTDNGIYQVQVAIVEFDDIPGRPKPSGSSPSGTDPTAAGKQGHKPINTALNMIPKGAKGTRLGSFVGFTNGREPDLLAKLCALSGLFGDSGIAVALVRWL